MQIPLPNLVPEMQLANIYQGKWDMIRTTKPPTEEIQLGRSEYCSLLTCKEEYNTDYNLTHNNAYKEFIKLVLGPPQNYSKWHLLLRKSYYQTFYGPHLEHIS